METPTLELTEFRQAARESVACPACRAQLNELCRSLSTKPRVPVDYVHEERLMAFHLWALPRTGWNGPK